MERTVSAVEPLRVNPELLLRTAGKTREYSENIASEHARAYSQMEAVLCGMPDESALAAQRTLGLWQKETTRLTTRVHTHADGFHRAATSYITCDNTNAESIVRAIPENS